VTAIFEILIAVLLEFYTQAGMLSCDAGKIVTTIFRKLFAIMTHCVILRRLGFFKIGIVLEAIRRRLSEKNLKKREIFDRNYSSYRGTSVAQLV
jgi:hypothetical protein